jgi:hypothetical protein
MVAATSPYGSAGRTTRPLTFHETCGDGTPADPCDGEAPTMPYLSTHPLLRHCSSSTSVSEALTPTTPVECVSSETQPAQRAYAPTLSINPDEAEPPLRTLGLHASRVSIRPADTTRPHSYSRPITSSSRPQGLGHAAPVTRRLAHELHMLDDAEPKPEWKPSSRVSNIGATPGEPRRQPRDADPILILPDSNRSASRRRIVTWLVALALPTIFWMRWLTDAQLQSALVARYGYVAPTLLLVMACATVFAVLGATLAFGAGRDTLSDNNAFLRYLRSPEFIMSVLVSAFFSAIDLMLQFNVHQLAH